MTENNKPEEKITKIQLRRGPEVDLPGQPLLLEPDSFSKALDEGELAFTTDSGRLFIGHKPVIGQRNHNRAKYPYQNIEILTENSPPDVLGGVFRTQTKTHYHQATIPPGGPHQVMVQGRPFRLLNLAFVGEIQYGFLTADGLGKRVGTLRMVHTDDGAPILQDNALGVPEDADDLSFDFLLSTSDEHLILRVRNSSGGAVNLFFRLNIIYQDVEAE